MRALGFLALSFLAVTSVARAQDVRPEEPTDSQQREQSRAAFRHGVGALQKQHWAEARDAFVLAYKLFPHPSILLDLGIARAQVGEVVQAEQDLTHFIAEDSTATTDELTTARTSLEGVRKHLGTLRVRVAPAGATVLVDDKPVALVAHDLTDVRVALGAHQVDASSPGYETWSNRVEVDGPDAAVVDLTLSHRGGEADHTSVPAQRLVSYVLFGAAVGLAGFGVFAGVHSIDLANQYNTPSEPNYQNPGTKSEGIAYRTGADVTLVVAGACIVAGVILYFTAPKSKRAAAATFDAVIRF